MCFSGYANCLKCPNFPAKVFLSNYEIVWNTNSYELIKKHSAISQYRKFLAKNPVIAEEEHRLDELQKSLTKKKKIKIKVKKKKFPDKIKIKKSR